MPIQLTTSITTGDIDPNGPYTQVKIVRFMLDSVQKVVELQCQYGNTDGEWVPGVNAGATSIKYFYITGEDYTTIVATESAAAEEIYYDKVAETLYQWLIDNEHYVGTIV